MFWIKRKILTEGKDSLARVAAQPTPVNIYSLPGHISIHVLVRCAPFHGSSFHVKISPSTRREYSSKTIQYFPLNQPSMIKDDYPDHFCCKREKNVEFIVLRLLKHAFCYFVFEVLFLLIFQKERIKKPKFKRNLHKTYLNRLN